MRQRSVVETVTGPILLVSNDCSLTPASRSPDQAVFRREFHLALEKPVSLPPLRKQRRRAQTSPHAPRVSHVLASAFPTGGPGPSSRHFQAAQPGGSFRANFRSLSYEASVAVIHCRDAIFRLQLSPSIFSPFASWTLSPFAELAAKCSLLSAYGLRRWGHGMSRFGMDGGTGDFWDSTARRCRGKKKR